MLIFDIEQVDHQSGDLLLWLLEFLNQKVVSSRMSRLSYGFLTPLSHYKPAVFDQTYKLPQIEGNCGFWLMKTRHLPNETESTSPPITPSELSSLSHFDKQGI